MTIARITHPRKELPVRWCFETGFPKANRQQVRAGLGHFNDFLWRGPLFEEIEEGSPHPHLLVVSGYPLTAPEKQARASVQHHVDPDDPGADPWAWSTLVLFPRWFQLNRRWLGIGGDARRENHIVHEGYHLVGALDPATGGHSSNLLSLMHPRFGWWPVRRGLNRDEITELRRVYGP